MTITEHKITTSKLKPGTRADKADGESAVLAKIAAMPEPYRVVGERLHAFIKASAPDLSPRVWYGMPAYAKNGKVVCFFRGAPDERYMTLGFSEEASLDEGGIWPTAFALKELNAAVEATIDALVKKATTTMEETKSGSKEETTGGSPSNLIDARIEEMKDWRGETLARVRSLIKQADPAVIEEMKWAKPSNSMSGVPVWSHTGILCTGETYKDKVKFTFAKGASLEDPSSLFNSSLEGNTRRAIDIHEGDKIDEEALKALIRAAVALNTSNPAKLKATPS